MSGTYGLEKFIEGPVTTDYYHSSPLHFLPDLDEDGDHLKQLRERFVLLAHGEGRYEDPNESWRVADALGAKGIPNRVDAWGEAYHHDWVTWRAMMPKYLEEFLPG
jgi:esterase/lipase superfamily enzyme